MKVLSELIQNALAICKTIQAEEEIPDEDLKSKTEGKDDDGTLVPVPDSKIFTAKAYLQAAATKGTMALAFSGGSDSMVLLDLTRRAGFTPTVVWADSQMEYPETREFIKKTVSDFGMELRIAQAARTPLTQWRRTGWPMLGKQAARLWNQANAGTGFKCNVSECCRAMKIGPARRVTKNIGCQVQITGQRGNVDDALRGMRTRKDGPLFFQQRDKIWIANPLTGWTDDDITAYAIDRDLPQHPAKGRGAKTIGCVFCGGGAQYTNSGYRILRTAWPSAWRRFMVEWGGGLVILAIKYKARLDTVRDALQLYGGLERAADERPWIFDFIRVTPRPGYDK